MTWTKSCQVGTTSGVDVARLQTDMTKSCQLGMTSTYEVVPNWHNLPKFVIFFKAAPFW